MIAERFLELLTKKLSDEISDTESEELKVFLERDEACRQQYNLFKSYWKHHEERYSNSDLMFQRIKKRIDVVEAPEEEIRGISSVRRISMLWRSVAAVLLVGICFTAFYYYSYLPVTTIARNIQTIKIPSRSKSKIVLSDGSVVTLNSETVLKYPAEFSGANREVYLSGEAFFNVTKDHKHPFIVHAGKMSIRVLGTAFNVKSYNNDYQSETTLIRGAIEVTLTDRPSDRIILKPHDKLILKSSTFKLYNENTQVPKVTQPDSVTTNYALTNLTYLRSNDTTVVETSWVNNKLIFKDEEFGEIANKMERWYGVKIKFKNPEVRDYHFTGVFEKESIAQALNALKLIEPFDYNYKNQTVYIY